MTIEGIHAIPKDGFGVSVMTCTPEKGVKEISIVLHQQPKTANWMLIDPTGFIWLAQRDKLVQILQKSIGETK